MSPLRGLKVLVSRLPEASAPGYMRSPLAGLKMFGLLPAAQSFEGSGFTLMSPKCAGRIWWLACTPTSTRKMPVAPDTWV
jgi:hypothetical protein